LIDRSGGSLDCRSTRVPEIEDPRDLVKRLTGRIVSRAAQRGEGEVLLHPDQFSVATGNDQADRRQDRFLRAQPVRIDVADQMIDAEKRRVPGPRQRLRGTETYKERTRQARPVRRGHEIDIGRTRVRFGESAVDHRNDRRHVLTRRDLRDDAARRLVMRHLRGDNAGSQRPAVFHDRGGSLVTRTLNGEHSHRV